MWSLIGLLVFLHQPEELGSCAATSGTVTTTTVASVTTTTTGTCADCTLDNPAITPLRENDGNVMITDQTLGVDANGCAIRTIFCRGNTDTSTVFISWNREAAGTTQGVEGAGDVTAVLTCSPDGTSWLLVANGIPITTAECDST